MKRSLMTLAAGAMALAAAGLSGGAAAADKDQAADLILQNGKILTPGGYAEAMAVRNGVLVAIGSSGDVADWRKPRTKVVDLKGGTVLPGFHDMHVHPLMGGQKQFQCIFEQGSTPDEIKAAVAACVKGRKKGEWIVGGQYQSISFGDNPPNRQFLDAVAPDNPVMLGDISGHSIWVNSKAIEVAGVTRDTPDPEGGVIERDGNGEPTGLFHETAGELIRRHVPVYTPAQNVKAMQSAVDEMLAQGITSFTDAAVWDSTILEAYATLAQQGKLKQRVRGCLVWGATVGMPTADDVIAIRNRYRSARFDPDCIKIFMDGVPTDSHTAAMLDDYMPVEGREGRSKGILMVEQEKLNAAVTAFDAQGFTVKFHAAGDGAVRSALDAIEAARKANGMGGRRHSVGHITFAHPDDLKRARDLGATLEYSPYLWFPSEINEDIKKAVGAERMERAWPVAEGLATGALVVVGSDWSVVPSVSPWIALETLVTRRVPGGDSELYAPSQAITLDQAVKIFTENAAREMGHRHMVGVLEEGMVADFIVLDRNPFEVEPTTIHDTQVRMTFIDGEMVYSAR